MTEPVASSMAGLASTKAGAAAGLAGIGLVGGAIMIAFDPPATRMQMFYQSVCAFFGSMLFGPVLVRVLDYYVAAIDIAKLDGLELFEVVAPIYFVTGALSWAAVSALAKFRKLVAENGGMFLAKKGGLNADATEKRD